MDTRESQTVSDPNRACNFPEHSHDGSCGVFKGNMHMATCVSAPDSGTRCRHIQQQQESYMRSGSVMIFFVQCGCWPTSLSGLAVQSWLCSKYLKLSGMCVCLCVCVCLCWLVAGWWAVQLLEPLQWGHSQRLYNMPQPRGSSWECRRPVPSLCPSLGTKIKNWIPCLTCYCSVIMTLMQQHECRFCEEMQYLS